jgi:chromosome segregation ATPase
VRAEDISPRRKIEEQLAALKKKEAELRRALAVVDHPELGDALREIEGRVYGVTRAEAKLAQGLSKAEERKKETLEKKLAAAMSKKAEIDAQIAEIEAELAPLGQERHRAAEEERKEALLALLATFTGHEKLLEVAGLDVPQLVPELARLLPEVRALADGQASA